MKLLVLLLISISASSLAQDTEPARSASPLNDGVPRLDTDVLGFLLPYEWSPLITLTCLLMAGAYCNGLVRGERPGFWSTVAFFLGVGLIYFVTQTRFDYLSQFVFFIHRAQHLVLHHVAAMLIALSNP